MYAGMFRLSAISAILVSTYANAMGLGEITLQSRIGEPLQAEVPIIGASAEQIVTTCFSLQARPGADLPVISAGSTRLIRDGQNYRLLITGHKPVSDPIFIVSVHATCGVELQRDYVMMPSPPLMRADLPVATEAAPPPAAPPTPRNFRSLRARSGDTLRSIAEAQSRDDPAQQERLLAAMEQLNPDLAADQALAARTPVRVPSWPIQTGHEPSPAAPRATARRTAPRPARHAPHHERRQEARPAAPPPAKVANRSSAGDRVVLGSAPDTVIPSGSVPATAMPAPAPSAGTGPETTEARIQRLEATLQQLNQEIEKLNTALALSTQALSMQQKLIDAQRGRPSDPVAISSTPPAPRAVDHSNRDNWLQLLISALAGGGIAAGVAHLFGRRQRSIDAELPLSVASYRSSPPFSTPRSSVFTRQQKTLPQHGHEAVPAAAVDLFPEPDERELSAAGSDNVEFNESDSALELAEIMLSFGRIRGAADTLAAHIEENAPDNIEPWSMLLDLYRRADMASEFESLAKKMRAKFNAQIPAWSDPGVPVSGLKSLEDYAHILWRLARNWGQQDCLDYLHGLVRDNRAGQRSGFPLEVVEEIVLLMRILDEAYGLKRPA